MSYLPRLADIVPQQIDLPNLGTLQVPIPQAVQGLFYRNLVLNKALGYYEVSIEIVLPRPLALAAIEGISVVLNPTLLNGATSSSFTLHARVSLPLLSYLNTQFSVVPTTLPGAYDLLLRTLKVADVDLLQAAITSFVAVTGFANATASPVNDFTTLYNARYAGALALNQTVAQLSAQISAGSSVSQVIYDLFIADSPLQIATLLRGVIGDVDSSLFTDLLRVDIYAAIEDLRLGLLLPRTLLTPVDSDNKPLAPTERSMLVARAATLKYTSGEGLVFDRQLAFDLTRSQLLQTGIILEITKAKPSFTYPAIAEALADGRNADFKGIYAEQVKIYLPNEFTRVSTTELVGRQLLIGTGGFSGLFHLGTVPLGQAAATPIFEATLFDDIKVKFTQFELAFSKNEVTHSEIKGVFVLTHYITPSGKPAEFGFDLTFSADGFELAFTAPVVAGKPVPSIVKISSVAELHFTRLAFGKDDHGIYLDLAADVVVTRALPIVGKAMPNKIAISKLRVDTTDGITVAAKPVWADGTTTAQPLEKGGDIVQAMSLTIAKVLKVDHIHLSLPKKAGTLTASATFDATLGLTDDSTASEASADGTPPPGFRASVSNAGFTATLTRTGSGSGTTQTGNLSLLNVGLAVKLPDAASVSINAGGLVGAGKLAILDGGTRYEGALALTFRDTLHLTAYALLNERLPDGSPGPSLLALITAQFEPIQLGLGFTLKGVGGLLGLHRTADTDYLRGLVRGGKMDQLLFPDNVLGNLTSALATINAAFPAAKGRYVIGLLAQLGWGTPELISLDVALLVELPAPVRLLVLGVLRAMLPTRQNDILSLRADFLGSIDFGAKKVSFDASLSDSHLWKFALSGDIAFRLFQGDNPVFVITAGGFHPSYQPPAGAGLTGLKRITLALAKNDRLRLTLESYFAVTSNTVQFGARLALYYAITRGFHVEGNFSFDALFQLNPFRVEVGVSASVAIKRGSSELLSLHLSLNVTGPGPWHVWGEASFKIWFIKISFDVDANIGERTASEPALQRPDVYTPLRAALLDGANWLVEAPANTQPSGVVLRPATAAAGQVFLDPRGAITLRQRVVPLGVRLEKFGSNPLAPTGGNYFEVPSFKVGRTKYSQADTPGNVEETRDFFAPSQYYKLTDGQKLSRPSFELLTNGLRITSLATLVGAPTATRRVVEYEQLLLDGAATGTAAGGTTPSQQLAGGARTARLTPDAFGKLARGSALGQATQAAQPSQRAPAPLGWATDTYEVVHAATLAVYDPAAGAQHPGHEKFGSHLEADQYYQALVAADATLAGELLVVPSYQLALA